LAVINFFKSIFDDQVVYDMKAYEVLLSDNKRWAAKKLSEDPGFFNRLVHVQTPEFLWIGCSDSRVPPNEITQTEPGEIFIHRNVANLVVNTDVNLMSVVDYAVNHLKIKHIVVCGHYGCGGIKAALSNDDFNQVLNMWLRNIKDIYRLHRKELELIPDEESRLTWPRQRSSRNPGTMISVLICMAGYMIFMMD
jgi:carbonic anhydrase